MPELTPEDKARIAAEERERERVRKRMKAEEDAKTARGCGIGCAVIIGIALLVWVISQFGGGTPPDQSPRGSSQTASSSPSVSVGSQGHLAMPAQGEVLLAVDPNAFDELTKALVAKDNYGIRELVTSGRVFFAANGTKVQVVDMNPFSRKVRLLEGPKVGMAGWIPCEWVK